MAKRSPLRSARRDARQGKSPSTQAGEFVRDEIHRIRSGKHGARSSKQAIAIGLSEARRAGVKLPAPRGGSSRTRKKAVLDTRRGRSGRKPSPRRSQATLRALKREGTASASSSALSQQARRAARGRTTAERRRAARKAAGTRKKAS
ncbi:MAG TPA: DUF6496 domain-containing protein [Candidatus Didemnitutus sp.]|jgi:hypothetical protein